MMNTIVVAENVTVTYEIGGGFDRWYTRQLEEERIKAEEERIEAELMDWLSDPANKDNIEYSDIYKDVYGFRPRW